MSGAKITTSLLGRLIAFNPMPTIGSRVAAHAGRVGRVVSVYTLSGVSTLDVEFADGTCVAGWPTAQLSPGASQLVPVGAGDFFLVVLSHVSGYGHLGIGDDLKAATQRALEAWHKSFEPGSPVDSWKAQRFNRDTLAIESLDDEFVDEVVVDVLTRSNREDRDE